MIADPSCGYEAAAAAFTAARSDVGAEVVRRWAGRLPRGGAVVDVGCGSGWPVSQVLVEEGLQVFGIDASPTLMSGFRRRFPTAPWACEAVETSNIFGRSFDGAVAVGLLFLLPEATQRTVVLRVSRAVRPGGRFLFSAPREACVWDDVLTGRRSASLGAERYAALLAEGGMRVAGDDLDEGGKCYLDAVKGLGEARSTVEVCSRRRERCVRAGSGSSGESASVARA